MKLIGQIVLGVFLGVLLAAGVVGAVQYSIQQREQSKAAVLDAERYFRQRQIENDELAVSNDKLDAQIKALRHDKPVVKPLSRKEIKAADEQANIDALCDQRDSSVGTHECWDRLKPDAPKVAACNTLTGEAYRLCVVKVPNKGAHSASY